MNKHNECCTEQCGSGLRNNYFEGKRITADAFNVEQKYLIERRRLLNRAIHGWGVVYGYELKNGVPAGLMGPRRLSIGAGLALDKCGRELMHTGDHVELNDIMILDENGKVVLDENGKPIIADKAFSSHSEGSCWLLSVHYAERPVGLVKVKDPCECEYDEWDHTCETVRFSLRPVPCKKCCLDFNCEPAPRHQEETHGEYSQDEQADSAATHEPCGCGCHGDHPTQKMSAGDECDRLCPIEESCGTVWVDIRCGVPLACLYHEIDDHRQWTLTKLEDCGPRRLIRDQTRISEIGWAEWHRGKEPVPFEEFLEGLGWIDDDKDDKDDYTSDKDDRPLVTKKFWIRFSRPVRLETLRPDCFAMTILGTDDEYWWRPLRVPIIDVDTGDFTDTGDPAGFVRGARIVVNWAWVDEAVLGRGIFRDDVTRVEFEIRGDFIVDCNGQTVDANARGLSPAPSGNGSPGDTFLSTFEVAANERPYGKQKKGK